MRAPGELAVERAAELAPRAEEEEWLVESLWGRSAVGIVGGQPKCMKTWFGLEMAVSVASGTPCLGRFPVKAPGPALVFLAEDALGEVRERIEALCRARGTRIEDLDLLVITEPVLRLDDEDSRERLERTVARYGPRLLLLDPLVRLHRLDENSATEISGLLGHLRELERSHDLAVVLVHHASKRRRAHPGQSLRGSSDLHAWTDSTAILARKEDRLVLTLEHRFAPAPAPMALRLATGPDGAAPHLEILGEVSPGRRGANGIEADVLDLVESAHRPLLRKEIREQVRVNNQRLGDVLKTLEASGRLHRTREGWVRAGNTEKRADNDLFAPTGP